MIIGVIDTGIDKCHKRLEHCDVHGIHLHEDHNGQYQLLDDISDQNGHGTGICAIIHKHAPEVSLFVVKVTAAQERISEGLLCTSIEYLLKHTDCTLVNISMGINTNYPSPKLKALCLKAFHSGILLIASAYYISEKECYPAYFSHVLGVGTGLVMESSDFKYLSDAKVNILAKGGFQRVAHLNNSFRFGSGTSLATAHFTGILASAFHSGAIGTSMDVQSWLKTNSTDGIVSITKHGTNQQTVATMVADEVPIISEILSSQQLPVSVERIALYPFDEKEIGSLMQFSHLVKKPITLGIGNAKQIKYNQQLTELFETNQIPTTNKTLTEQELALFDTLVVGYFLDQLLDHNLFYGYKLLQRCIAANKNLIVWDSEVFRLVQSLIKQQSVPYKGKVFFTHVDGKLIKKLYALAPLPKLQTPVLAVVGTGSKQGKFTTQLIIKDVLEKTGYKISHVATEPQGILFGADFTFPFGHHPTVSVNTGEWGRILATYMQCIELLYQPEIIITGGQGGVIPVHPVNFGANGAGLKSLSYLMGVYPDVLIVTISPHDQIDFILKTEQTIQAYVNCTVIFYCLTPHTFMQKSHGIPKNYVLDDHAYQEKRRHFEKHLGKPVIDILDSTNRQFILEAIQSSFAVTNVELT